MLPKPALGGPGAQGSAGRDSRGAPGTSRSLSLVTSGKCLHSRWPVAGLGFSLAQASMWAGTPAFQPLLLQTRPQKRGTTDRSRLVDAAGTRRPALGSSQARPAAGPVQVCVLLATRRPAASVCPSNSRLPSTSWGPQMPSFRRSSPDTAGLPWREPGERPGLLSRLLKLPGRVELKPESSSARTEGRAAQGRGPRS